MIRFTPAPDLVVLMQTLTTLVNRSMPSAGVQSTGAFLPPGPLPNLPPMPARPADPDGAAFHDRMVAPLYAARDAALAAIQAALPPVYKAPPPQAVVAMAQAAALDPVVAYNTVLLFQGYAPDGSAIWMTQAQVDQATASAATSAP